jgi:hypothetical protein
VALARAEIFQARWSEDIHREWMQALPEQLPNITKENVQKIREHIDQTVPDCLVRNYRSLIAGLELPDPDDRHVLAAASSIWLKQESDENFQVPKNRNISGTVLFQLTDRLVVLSEQPSSTSQEARNLIVIPFTEVRFLEVRRLVVDRRVGTKPGVFPGAIKKEPRTKAEIR